MATAPPVALTIAGSDCSAGAGIQADLKTFQHFGVHGLTAVTCVVSETPNIVRAVHPVPPEVVRDQVELLLDTFPVAAAKTGMLFSAAHIEVVADILRARPDVSLVVDPVMIASTGDPLIEDDAVAVYRERLLPVATLVTPNIPEAETLLGQTISGIGDLEPAARALAERLGSAVLLKGGHLPGRECIDLLFSNGVATSFSAPRLDVAAAHGTGCTLSAAIVARLAKGDPLTAAIARAKDFLTETLRRSYTFEHLGGPPVSALDQGTRWGRSV